MVMQSDETMLFAALDPAVAITIGIAASAVLILLGLFFFFGYENLAQRSLERKYADLDIHDVPRKGDVILSYHTYHGFISWFTQTTHHVALPPDDARKLLGRLLRFNLIWGLVMPGAFLIPPLAISNYFAQRRSITKQDADGEWRNLVE